MGTTARSTPPRDLDDQVGGLADRGGGRRDLTGLTGAAGMSATLTALPSGSWNVACRTPLS